MQGKKLIKCWYIPMNIWIFNHMLRNSLYGGKDKGVYAGERQRYYYGDIAQKARPLTLENVRYNQKRCPMMSICNIAQSYRENKWDNRDVNYINIRNFPKVPIDS